MSIKEEIAKKLTDLLNKEIKMTNKIKHSSNHVDEVAGLSGILKEFYQEDGKTKALIGFVLTVTLGKKANTVRPYEIWVDVRDIVGFEETKEKKTRKKKQELL